ncbi:hypothetical protein N9792_05325 [Planktomarina temperata]|nr:hypothetical protein [Planktomarina temperata]MDB4200532.1 hypothetical protein [Planktomarina temperata]MDC1193768.1 hypothetical protein [Planktomarina temperata]
MNRKPKASVTIDPAAWLKATFGGRRRALEAEIKARIADLAP